MIESSQNQLFRLLKSLHRRSGREKAGLYLLEGVRLVEAALAAGVRLAHAVYSPELIANPRGQACLQRMLEQGCQAQAISPSLFQALAETEHSQGLIACANLPSAGEPTEAELRSVSRLLLVDGVQDPGNLGTIIRTADALGVDLILTLSGTVDVHNAKVVRSAMGSLFHLPIRQGQQADGILPLLRRSGLQLVVSSLAQAIPYQQAVYAKRVALVVGNEGAGVSCQLLQAADLRVVIPISGQAESLNVAVATGIMLAELGRR